MMAPLRGVEVARASRADPTGGLDDALSLERGLDDALSRTGPLPRFLIDGRRLWLLFACVAAPVASCSPLPLGEASSMVVEVASLSPAGDEHSCTYSARRGVGRAYIWPMIQR